MAKGLSGWIDRNLDHRRGEEYRGEKWSYVFKEAVSCIWYARNKELLEEEYIRRDLHTIVADVYDRARNIRLAWKMVYETDISIDC